MHIQDWIDALLVIADALKIGEDDAFVKTYDEPFKDSESYPCFIIDPQSIIDEPQNESAYPTGPFRRSTDVIILMKTTDNTKAARKIAYDNVDARTDIFVAKLVENYFKQELRVISKEYHKFGIGSSIVHTCRLRFSVLMYDEQVTI